MLKYLTKPINKVKKGISWLLLAVMVFSMNGVSTFAAEVQEVGKYEVPITGLESTAPIPAVKTAFANAFGNSLSMEIREDGSKSVVIRPQHMIVDFAGAYHCNVLTVAGGQVLETKTDRFSPNFGNPGNVMDHQVPAAVQVNLPEKNGEGSYDLTITVDFMNSFLGGGVENDYPTVVKLKLNEEGKTPILADYSQVDQAVAEAEEKSKNKDLYVDFSQVEQAVGSVIRNLNVVRQNEVNAMAEAIYAALKGLEYKGADYRLVDEAIREANSKNKELYKNFNEVEKAIAEVDRSLTMEDEGYEQKIEAMAKAIQDAIENLEYKDADYSGVDQAIQEANKKNKDDYVDFSKVEQAINSVQRGFTIDKQKDVDNMEKGIREALTKLKKKEDSKKPEAKPEEKPEIKPESENKPESTSQVLDKDHLKDGVYEIKMYLWHESKNQASMAASSLNNTGRIVVKNGSATVYMYTQPMKMGSITASLQEIKVYDLSGNYVNGTVEAKDAQGNPTCFSFPLPHKNEYIDVKVNPHVEMMGNQDINARLKMDYATLTQISSDGTNETIDVTKPSANSGFTTTAAGNKQGSKNGKTVPKTGDETPVIGLSLAVILSLSVVVLGIWKKKRKAA